MNVYIKRFFTNFLSFHFNSTAEISPKNCMRFHIGPPQSARTQICSKMCLKLLFYIYLMEWCLWICIGGDVGDDLSKIQFSNLPAETQDWGSWRLQGKKTMANVTNYFFSILFAKGLVSQYRKLSADTTTNSILLLEFSANFVEKASDLRMVPYY